jgi:site-specific recombinase XerD
VDVDRREVHLPKTSDGHPRTIQLIAVALATLEQLRDVRSGVRSENHVIPSARRGEASQGALGWFPTAVEKVGIKGSSWHCNRHTFASRLVMARVDLRTVAELLGHRTLQMVMQYSHLAPEHQANAVDRLVSA